MLPLFVALLVSIAIICAALQRMRKSHNALRERFVAEDALMSVDITEEDKYLYFLIIDMYVQNLERDPTEEELLDNFTRLKTNELTMHDVYNRIVDSDEYYMLKPSRPVPDLKEPNAPRVSDYDVVYAMLLEEMPDEKNIFYEKSDSKGFMSYILSKYVAFDRDIDLTREFVRRTPEYMDAHARPATATTPSMPALPSTTAPATTTATATAPSLRSSFRSPDDTASSAVTAPSLLSSFRAPTVRSAASSADATYATSTADPIEDPIDDPPVADYVSSQFDETLMDVFDGGKTRFNFNRPHVGRSTIDVAQRDAPSVGQRYDDAARREELKEASACEMYAQSQKLSHLVNQRDIENLRYKCELSKGYNNVQQDLTLLPDQTWSVPQKHTPVCHRTECTVNDPYAQSSLIGTLLDDARDDRIMPTFEYKEAL